MGYLKRIARVLGRTMWALGWAITCPNIITIIISLATFKQRMNDEDVKVDDGRHLEGS
jgi:hypothetical protein